MAAREGTTAKAARRLESGAAANGARIAEALLYLPLAPMAGLAVATILDLSPVIERELAQRALLALGAVTLSFLGGIRWGVAMRVLVDGRHLRSLAASFLPALAGWVALLLPARPGLALMAATFAAQGCWDVWSTDQGEAPAWYGRARLRSTFGATAILAAALVLGP
jgi:hypothetical protein